MTSLGKLLAVGFATVGTAAAASIWGTVHLTQSPRKAAASKPAPNIFCVASDSVLRLLASGDRCPSGQKQFELSIAELHDFSDGGPWGSTPPARPNAMSVRLASLERRLGRLEKSPLFEVIDKNGALVFRVAQGSATLYNHSETAVAEMRATASGGFFVGRSSDGALESFAGASGTRAGIRITEGHVTHIDLGKQAAGNYSLTMPSNIDGNVAAIGESRAGTGALALGSKMGGTRVLMSVAEEKGRIDMFNSRGLTILFLTEGDARGGSLTLADATSEPMVKMNENGRYGAVLTGPVAGFPLIQGSGLPGSYVLGCGGGEACRP